MGWRKPLGFGLRGAPVCPIPAFGGNGSDQTLVLDQAHGVWDVPKAAAWNEVGALQLLPGLFPVTVAMGCVVWVFSPSLAAQHPMAPCKPSQGFLSQPRSQQGFEVARLVPAKPLGHEDRITSGQVLLSDRWWLSARMGVGTGSPSPKASPPPHVAQSRPVPKSRLSPAPLEAFQAGSGHPGKEKSRGSPVPALAGLCPQLELRGRVQASLPHRQLRGSLDEAFSLSIILPALEMPKSPGNLCYAQFGSGVWVPRDAGTRVLQMAVERKPGEKAWCDLSRLANLHADVPSPVPFSASVGWCPGWKQPPAPGCPGDVQPAQAVAQPGKDRHRATQLVL